MSTPSGDPLVIGLESEVELEMALVESSRPAVASSEAASQWQIDPSDIAREEAGLRNLLGAVDALEAPASRKPEGRR